MYRVTRTRFDRIRQIFRKSYDREYANIERWKSVRRRQQKEGNLLDSIPCACGGSARFGERGRLCERVFRERVPSHSDLCGGDGKAGGRNHI